MKKLFFILLFITTQIFGACPTGMMQVWTQTQGLSCSPRFVGAESQILCLPMNSQPLQPNWMQGLPISLSAAQPWWSSQGNLYYPNMNYPGAWSYPGIEANYYPGEGQIFAAKPNVYVETVHKEKKFNFKFITKQHFLATTPVLTNDGWKGKIFEKDKFQVDDVNYDYLFYDVRLPKEKMQFDHGLCTTRAEVIEWMLKDLKELNHSTLSLQDFEEHWRVKIPDYPFYCIYPQYNRELDASIPIEIDLEQSSFIRSLYVLVPHKTEPNVDEPQDIPFPTMNPSEYRPGVKILRENTFREWGVAFLGY